MTTMYWVALVVCCVCALVQGVRIAWWKTHYRDMLAQGRASAAERLTRLESLLQAERHSHQLRGPHALSDEVHAFIVDTRRMYGMEDE